MFLCYMVPNEFLYMLDPYFRIGEQKRSFCEAVNGSLCDQEGKFLFAMLVQSDEIYMFLFHMSVGAEQAREVVTLVTSEAPCSLQWVET